MPHAALATASAGLVLGDQQARLQVGLAAPERGALDAAPHPSDVAFLGDVAGDACAIEQRAVGRRNPRDDLDAQARQLRLELRPQRLGAPVQRTIVVHRFGASIVPRHFLLPQRHSYCCFSFGV